MKVNEIFATTIKYRGIILHQMSFFEKQLDNYIIYYFLDKSPDKIAEMQLLIFGDNRINIEAKNQIFQFLVEHHDLEWGKKYKSIRKFKDKPKVDLFADIKYIIETRNVMAHCLPDTTDEALKDENNTSVGFLKFKNEGKKISFTPAKFKELEEIIVNLQRYLLEHNKMAYPSDNTTSAHQ